MAKSKQQTLTVQVSVRVPEGTSRTRVEKAVSTLLKSGNAPEGFKLGSPKVVTQNASPASESAPACAM